MQTNETRPPRGSVFRTHWRWWTFLLAASVVAGAFQVWLRRDEPRPGVHPALADSLLWTFAPEAIGGAIGLLLLPLILAGVVWLIARLARRPLRTETFMVLYTCLWALLAFFSMIGAAQDSRAPMNHAGTQRQVGVDGHLYQPSGSEYSVKFDSAPTVRSMTIPYGDQLLRGETAELVLGEQGFQRIEFVPFPRTFLREVNERTAIDMLRQYAIENGIRFPELEYEETDLGRIVRMRGVKHLQDQRGVTHRVTYVAHIYFGSESALMLYAGAPAEQYPTPPVARFLGSVRRPGVR